MEGLVKLPENFHNYMIENNEGNQLSTYKTNDGVYLDIELGSLSINNFKKVS